MNTNISIAELPLGPVASKKPAPDTFRICELKVMSMVNEAKADLPKVVSPHETALLFREVIAKSDWFDAEKECFVVVILNRKNVVKGFNLVSLGTQSSSLVHPREVFRAAVVAAASSIICIHNHPSGDPTPSAADMQVTRQLREAAKVVDIGLLDHVIVGDKDCDPAHVGFYSFRDAGVL